MPTKAELHEFTNIIIDTKLKIWNCTKKSTKLYFRILIYKNYTLDELNFIQKLLTPAHRWQKCARKTLGTNDWICKVALSSKVIMTIVLVRKKMMQLMAWIRYNRIKQFETPINSNITVKGLNPGVISKGWVWSSGWT